MGQGLALNIVVVFVQKGEYIVFFWHPGLLKLTKPLRNKKPISEYEKRLVSGNIVKFDSTSQILMVGNKSDLQFIMI
jgi:hypothetical protein